MKLNILHCASRPHPLPWKHQGFASCAAQKQNLSSLCSCQNFATYKLSKRIQRVHPHMPKVGPAPRWCVESLSHLSVQERTVPTADQAHGSAGTPQGQEAKARRCFQHHPRHRRVLLSCVYVTASATAAAFPVLRLAARTSTDSLPRGSATCWPLALILLTVWSKL